MKRIFAILLIAALLLCGCAENVPPAQTTAAPTVATTAARVWEYVGNMKGYEYYYEDGRDLKWEEDVLYVAEVYLGEKFANGHPLLTDMEFQTFYAMDGYPVEFASHYNEQMREEFIRDINELIPRIQDMEDYEVLFALSKAIAKLDDLHSYVAYWNASTRFYPLSLVPLFTDEGKAVYYANAVPEKHEYLLFAELTAINDVPLREVLELLRPYVSVENEAAFVYQSYQMLIRPEALKVIGMVGSERDAASFTFLLADGTTETVELPSQTSNNMPMVGKSLHSSGALIYRNEIDPYWWEYLEENKTVYIRFNEIQENRNCNYSAFLKQLQNHMKAVPETEKIIVDLRGNPGGVFHANMYIMVSSFLEKQEAQQSYVLIDGASYSAAIHLSSSINQMSEKTLLVGEPGGQPANFFASVHTYQMPNSGSSFTMSDCWWVTNEFDTNDALMPDVILYQTLEDYKNGVDTVLDRVLNGEVTAE